MPCLHARFEVIENYHSVLLKCVECKRMFDSYEGLRKSRQKNVQELQTM